MKAKCPIVEMRVKLEIVIIKTQIVRRIMNRIGDYLFSCINVKNQDLSQFINIALNKQMQSQDSVSLHSSSDEDNNEISLQKTTPILNGQTQTKPSQMKEAESDSSYDSEIEDLREKSLQSEKQSDEESVFEYEDEAMDDDEDKSSRSQSEEEIGEIFDKENEEENALDDEDQQQTESQQVKNDLDGPKIKVTLRDYQKTLFQKSQDRNSIIYLPTGLGKTRIAIASMYYYLSYTQKKKVVFLANTVQLVKQQAEAIRKTLHGIIQNKPLCKQLNKKHSGNEVHLDWTWERICREVVCIHGEKNEEIGQTKKKKIESSLMSKKEFLRKFENSTVIVVISQMFLNCLRRGFIKLTDFSFIVFDECHHCQGDHPYAGIMNQFYFDLKKKLQKQKRLQRTLSLPKIMGLTASPIPNPQKNQKRLQKMIQQLCINMDSNFVEYPNSESGNQTKIDIIEINETEQKKDNPYLLTFFEKNTSHREAYDKIQYYFPLYFNCVREVIELMQNRYECLKLNRAVSEIHQPELFFFYDIKECLLKKIKDLWLELGEYVMCLALGDMITQLNNITGIKDQANQQLLKDIIKILIKHQKILKTQFQFNQMPQKYFSAKLIKLIEILSPKQQDEKEGSQINDNDLVLVFAFKRRTVEYLDKFFQKYRQKLPENKKKYFECTGVTGYSAKRVIGVMNQGFSYESNPSSKTEEFKIDQNYQKYIEDYRETMKKTTGVTSALQNELNRFKNASITKFLLETEQKYASQLRKITQFRKKQKRILISTSVTEQGFDIPGCNKVISFDTPFSMKAYIQIKGRARKKNSIYYIFTSEVNYKTMNECKDLYEDTINATYQIAINRIAKKEIKAEQRKQKKGYRKVPTKGGALLNSNYALEILKIYFTTLAQPNKGYFHFIETPNIMYKCAIKMPQSDPSGIPMFVGEALSRKDEALKSAAFNAVKALKILGLIKDDLRPSKLQQLQDQFELQKYNDLQIIQTDEDYREIFQKYTQFEEEKQLSSNRTFLRIHFKSIRSEELDFRFINPKFEKATYEFNNKEAKFPFQLYQVAFSNTRNHNFLKEYDNSNEIGLLTCFDESLNDKLFSNFNYRFEENPNESFTLKKINTSVELTLEEFTKLRNVHEFLVAGCDNKEVMYYIEQTKTPPQNSLFRTVKQSHSYIFDKNRQFYPLLVLLKGKKEGRNEKKYEIDFNKIQKIKHHNELFKKLYLYNNRTKHSKANEKFSENLIQQYESFATSIPGNENITLIQSISNDFLFHKCIIKNRIKYSQEIINETKKNATKYNLQKREQKFSKVFQHFKSQKNDLIQRDLWRNFQKQKRLTFFDQGGIKQQVLKNDKFYFLKEFVEYPISPQTLFKVSLAKRYVYDALGSYTKALSFINIKLYSLFEGKNKRNYHPLYFNHYENVILANGNQIFEHLADNGKSKMLRQLGRSYKAKNTSMSFNQSMDKSSFPNMSDISGIQGMNQSAMNENSMSMLNMNKKGQMQEGELSSNSRVYRFDGELLGKLRIPDVQKVLTSKTYKHQRSENYEQFEFIGDVVLKYLATLQIFCTRPKAVQGQMHIARANIICNANLHRKAIKSQIFRYIMASKNPQLCPPYKLTYDESKVEKERYLGKNSEFERMNIMMVNKASQSQGYQYIAGKVHADVVEALIGAFYYAERRLQDCQQLLYALDVLKTPSLDIDLFSTYSYPYNNLPACYTQLQSSIGYSFTHKGLLLQALTHQTFRSTLQTILDDRNMTRLLQTTQNQLDKISFLSDNNTIDYRTKIKFNETFYERLEFLGDAVLDLIVVEHLYDKYDRGLDEGTLTLLKQAGVSNKSLGLIAVKFKLHELTLMDIPELDNLQKEFAKLKNSFDQYVAHPEKLQNLHINQIKLLGDVFEGLIGAILIDQDFNYYSTKKIVWKMIGKYIDVFTNKQNVSGFPVKSFLQNNNYTNCRIDKISKEFKDGKFQYGLIDRKHTVIEKCYAFNQKDAWDIIMEIIQAKQKGMYKEQEDIDESF